MTDEYRSARRAEIAEAAQAAFRRKGFQATSMAEIMAESGLSAGAIYNQYKGKADIVHDVANRISRQRLDELDELKAQNPLPAPSAVVRALITAMASDLTAPAQLLQVWGEAATDPDLAEMCGKVYLTMRQAHIEYISLWHQREHGLSPEEADAVGVAQAPLFLSAVHGYVVQSTIVPDFDGAAYLDAMEALLPR